MENGKIKILYSVPMFGDCSNHFFQCWTAFVSHNWKWGIEKGIQFDLFSPTKQIIASARQCSADQALANGYDYLFFLDDDMIIPSNTLEKLYNHNVGIVSALSFQRRKPYKPVVIKINTDDKGKKYSQWIEDFPRGLIKGFICGCACTLIKTEVFKQMSKPFFFLGEALGEDVYFFQKANYLGYDSYIDTSLEIGHVGERRIITGETYRNQKLQDENLTFDH